MSTLWEGPRPAKVKSHFFAVSPASGRYRCCATPCRSCRRHRNRPKPATFHSNPTWPIWLAPVMLLLAMSYSSNALVLLLRVIMSGPLKLPKPAT